MLSFHITSSIGWRFREKFYQPYQILELQATEQSEYQWFENNMYDGTPIEELNVRNYFLRGLLHVSETAKQLYPKIHHFSNYYKTMVTDGRRLFKTDRNSTFQVSHQQTVEAKTFLENLKDKIHLDIPFDLLMEVEELKKHIKSSLDSSSNDNPSLDSIAEANLMED